MNWIFICTAIVKYAEYIKKEGLSLSNLKNLTLKTVINTIYSNNIMFAEYLNDYVTWRKNFRMESDLRGDHIGEMEVSVDNKYNLDYNI